MTTALRIVAVCLALFVGLLIAALLLFGGPNYYGLRPHAVKPDMDRWTVDDLTTLAQNGPVTGILAYDAWYKDRRGATGWFLLPIAHAQDTPFRVNGALDPALAAMFGAAPRRCNGTSLSEKMIRAIEPERTQSGFLGRSTCSRANMDISQIIAAGRPAIRHTDQMTHKELSTFDAQRNPWVQRDAVPGWPTSYAYHRTLSLPVVWQRMRVPPAFTINDLRDIASQLADTLSDEGSVSVRLLMREWYPRSFTDITPDLLPLVRAEGTVMITDIRFARLEFVVLCAVRAACDAVDVSSVLVHTAALRNQSVLGTALANKRAPPKLEMAFRDSLFEANLGRASLLTPASTARHFPVTWYDARNTTTLK